MLGTPRVLKHDVTFRYKGFVASNRSKNKEQSFFRTNSKEADTIERLKMIIKMKTRQISRIRREVDENCAVQGYYAASSGNSLPTFRDNLWVPSSGVKNSESGFFTLEDETRVFLPLRMGPISCPEISVRNYHYALRDDDDYDDDNNIY